jgi:hypothetical protein
MLFLRRCAEEQCYVSVNDKVLADIYAISLGNVRKIRCNARRRELNPSHRTGRPAALSEDQEVEIVQNLLRRASEGLFMKKSELLDEIERVYGKVLTFGWIHRFVTRHQDEIATGTVYPQEDPRLQIPRHFLDDYLALLREHVAGLNPHLVYNLDETGCSDWEERKSFDAIIPAALRHVNVHFGVTRRVKHQSMIVCISAAGDALCPLITTSDRSTLGVFRDGIEENVDLRVHVGGSSYVDKEVFHAYIRDVLIPNIENFRSTSLVPNATAVLLMNNCGGHLGTNTIRLLTERNVKVITFPPHRSGIFQMLDLVFFGVFKHAKSRIPRNTGLAMMQDHALRMFRAHEAAATSSIVRGSFKRAGFTYVKQPGGTYSLGLDEARIRTSPEFPEVWNIDFPFESLSGRRQGSPWGFLNPNPLAI